MAPESSSEELLASVAQGSHAALALLYDRLAPSLLGMILRILNDRGAAGEVLQEAFLRLWKESGRLERADASVAVWLMFVARGAALRRLPGHRWTGATWAAAAAHLPKAPTWLPRPKQIALLEERRDLLAQSLSRLPAAQRRTLELVFFEGQTEVDIARRSGEPLGKVKTELRGAMRYLRHRLRAVLGTWSANI